MGNDYLKRLYTNLGTYQKPKSKNIESTASSIRSNQAQTKYQLVASEEFKEEHNDTKEICYFSSEIPKSSEKPIKVITPTRAKAAVEAMTDFSSRGGKVLWVLKCLSILPLFKNLYNTLKSEEPEKFGRAANIKSKYKNAAKELCDKLHQTYAVIDGKMYNKDTQSSVINEEYLDTTKKVQYKIQSDGIYFINGNNKSKHIFKPTDDDSLKYFIEYITSIDKYSDSPKAFAQDLESNVLNMIIAKDDFATILPTAEPISSNKVNDTLWTETEAKKIKELVQLKNPDKNNDIFLFLHGSGDNERKAKSSQLTFSQLHSRLTNEGFSSAIVDGPSAKKGKRATRNIFNGLENCIKMIEDKVHNSQYELRLNLLGHSRGGCEDIVINNYLCILIQNNFNLDAMKEAPYVQYHKLLIEHFGKNSDFITRLTKLSECYSHRKAEDDISIRVIPSDPVTGPMKILGMKHSGFQFVRELLTIKNHERFLPICQVEHTSWVNKHIFDPIIPECLEHINVILLNVEHGHLVRYPKEDGKDNYGHYNSYQMFCWMVGLEPESNLTSENIEKHQKTYNQDQVNLKGSHRKKLKQKYNLAASQGVVA